MKLVLISDTHGYHRQVQLPKGDVLIHAGDVSKRGYRDEVLDFLDWFGALDYSYKVFIAGNHDFFFEREPKALVEEIIPESVIYLNDSGVDIEGVKIWGSPIQPWFFDWAFNRSRGKQIQQHWDLIPKDTDILITHGPPYSHLDATVKGELVGCEDLAQTIETTKVKLHVFGHIHEAYGIKEVKNRKFVNASVLNFKYEVVNAPIVLDF